MNRFADYYNLNNSGGELDKYDVDPSKQSQGFTYVASSYGYSFRADKTSPSSLKVKTEIDNDRPLKAGFKNDAAARAVLDSEWESGYQWRLLDSDAGRAICGAAEAGCVALRVSDF